MHCEVAAVTIEQARLVYKAVKQITTTRNVRVSIVGRDPLTGREPSYEVHIQQGSFVRPSSTVVIKDADVWLINESTLKD